MKNVFLFLWGDELAPIPRPGFNDELPSGPSLMVRVPHHDPELGRRVRVETSRTKGFVPREAPVQPTE